MTTDPRYRFVRSQLSRLATDQLRRVLDTPPGQIVTDTFAFDPNTGAILNAGDCPRRARGRRGDESIRPSPYGWRE